MFRGILLTATALALCSGCDHDDDDPETQEPRAPIFPTAEELHEASFELVFAYPTSATYPWTTWRGEALLTLYGPNLGEPELPCDVVLLEGFEELYQATSSACFESAARGTWTYDEATGLLTAQVVGPTSGTTASVEVFLESGYTIGGTGGTYAEMRGSGIWQVSPGPSCGPGTFAGGTAGDVTAEEVVISTGVIPATEGSGEPEVRVTVYHLPTGETTTIVAPESVAAGLLSD